MSTELKPGQVIKPEVTQDQAKVLAENLYGFRVVKIEEFVSYDDKNFYMEFDGSSSNPHVPRSPNQGVFKVTNILDSRNPEITEAISKAVILAKERGYKLNIPLPIKNKTGTYHSMEQLSKEDVNIVRLLEFIPGKILHKVPYTSSLLFQCGKYLAQLNNLLQDFTDSALTNRSFIWMVSQVPRLTEFLYVIEDEERKQTCERVLSNFQQNVVPKFPDLPKGIIHGDFNEQNIIVNLKDGEYVVDGVIDFADVHESCYLFEIVMTTLYGMIDCETMDKLEAGGHVLAGYLTERTLTETEYQIFKDVLEARLVQSLVLGAYSYYYDKSNTYVLTTAPNGWKLLDRLSSTSQQQLYTIWARVITSYDVHLPHITEQYL